MKNPTKPSSTVKTSEALALLRRLVDALPSDEERRQVSEDLDAVVAFLKDLKAAIATLPSAESMADTKASLEKVSDTVTRLARSPVVAKAIGVRETPSLPAFSDSDRVEANEALGALSKLPVDSIRTVLSNEVQVPLVRLRALASILRIGGVSKATREALMHQVTMKIANSRTYDQLRTHQAASGPSEPVTPDSNDDDGSGDAPPENDADFPK